MEKKIVLLLEKSNVLPRCNIFTGRREKIKERYIRRDIYMYMYI